MVQEQPSRIGRRLSAIVAADVAGYSRLMGLDEAGTARILREHRAATDALVAKHGGRIVKTTGDGLLIEFPSVVDAVECAVAVQTVMTERNEGIPKDRRMLFRIGINLGDILIEGDDILGDGVNVAARLEGIPNPVASVSRLRPMNRFAARSMSSSPIWASITSRISPARYGPMPQSGMGLA
jgi:class 3 adenylate cyclase